MKTPQTAMPNNPAAAAYGTIETGAAKELVAAGSVREVSLIAAGAVWVIALQVRMEQRLIRAQRGNERRFKTADAALRFCYDELGLSHVTVHMAHYAKRTKQLPLSAP